MATARKTRDEYYLELLTLVAGRSTCGRRAVGAIITTYDGQILSTGYNGVPRRFPHCTEVECPGRHDEAGNTDRCEAVHAEVNAVLQCKRLDLAHTIYVSCTPCFSCAKMLCNTSIQRVVVRGDYADARGKQLFSQANIALEIIYQGPA